MDRKDILRKAQEEGHDEREEQIKDKAFHIGWISVSLVLLFLIVFRSIYNESASDILMILMAQIGSISFYQYFKIREKRAYLFAGIGCILALFLALAALLSEYGVY